MSSENLSRSLRSHFGSSSSHLSDPSIAVPFIASPSLDSMPSGGGKVTADKLTDSEKKQKKQENKAKANPKMAAEKKEKNDACREKRKAAGSSKTFS